MFISWMLILPSFKKSLIVEQFQGNCLNDKDGKNDQYYMKSVFLSYSTVLCTACCLPFPRVVLYLFPGIKMFTFPQECFLFPRVLFMLPQWSIYVTFSQGYYLPFPKDAVYLSPRILFTFPQDVICLSPGILFTFPHRYVYLSPGMLFTFPQGCCLLFPRDVIYLSPGWIPSRLSWFTSFPKCKVTLRLLVSWILTEFSCSQKKWKRNWMKYLIDSWQNNDFFVLSLDDHITECKIPSPSAKASRSPTASGTNLA